MADEVLARSERRGDGGGPAAVVVDELAHAPKASWKIAGNQTGLIDLELRTIRRVSCTEAVMSSSDSTHPFEVRGRSIRARATTAGHVDHDGADGVRPRVAERAKYATQSSYSRRHVQLTSSMR